MSRVIAIFSVAALVAFGVNAVPAAAADDPPVTGWDPAAGIYRMVFPVDDPHGYGDTWHACRDGCSRLHEGTDIFASKMTKVYAAAAGTVGWMHDEQGGNCCAMALEHDDGWATWYIHLNNDTPGTDDGQGWGFAPGITSGVHVDAGQFIAYVGDSGNAESTSPHLHFELHQPDGTKINPYPHLVAAESGDPGVPGLPVMVEYRVDDGPQHDGTGNDSIGNNDGIAQCGETIELYLTLRNDGEATLANLSASLAVPDSFVNILYNTKSSYPNLDVGESAENPRDWDLRIAPDTPGGHHFTAAFTVKASIGGPWLIEVPIPIECGDDITPPQVDSLSPHHGDYEVPVDSDIVATFDEPVDPATVTTDSFIVENASVLAGAITVAGDGLSATFDPDENLGADSVYSVTLTSDITDLVGNPLVPYGASFSTGTIPADAIVDVGMRIDDGPEDDGTGNDSIGNNDGAARCGETIELYATVRNDSNLVISGLSGALSQSDPYLRLLYNINSPYPELSPGATSENIYDWDLRIDKDTPVGYEAIVTITFSVLDPVLLSLQPIDSAFDLVIPIECSPPSVTGVDPADDAVDVPVDGVVKVTFSKPIDETTVTSGTFKVDDGHPVSGTVTVAGNRRSATFTPDSDLEYETVHSVTVTEGVTDRAGNPVTLFTSSFTTEEPDLTPPEVVSVQPADLATGVAVGTDVTVTFSEPVDPGSVTTSSFSLSDGSDVPGTVDVAGDGMSATFDPDSSLGYDTVVDVSADSGITDLSGNPLVPFASSFTTGPEPPDEGVPVLESYRVDDGPQHDGTGNDSKGNNDGLAQCGEIIELYVTVMNAGEVGLSGVTGTLLESDPYVSLLYNTTSSYPAIGGGESAENLSDWDLKISANTPNEHSFDFTVRYVANGGGPWDVDVSIPIGCGGGGPAPGSPALASYRVDDGPQHDGTGNDSKGNNDGLAQCGEIIELYVTLENAGDDPLTGLSATLLESDAYLTLLYNTSAPYPNLAGGNQAENIYDWDLKVAADTPNGHDFVFTLRITANEGGPWDVEVSIPVSCGGGPAPDPGLPVALDIRVDDGPQHDGTGNDSKGNNDGLAQCGEIIELYVRLKNEGASKLTGLSATLLESDDLVKLLYNTSSAYPDLLVGADAENPRDWDLKISADTPDDHEFSFTLRVTADGGFEWDIPLSLTIHCP